MHLRERAGLQSAIEILVAIAAMIGRNITTTGVSLMNALVRRTTISVAPSMKILNLPAPLTRNRVGNSIVPDW